MENTFNQIIDTSMYLQKTGVSSFSLQNEIQVKQSSGGDTGVNDHIQRILNNAGFIIADTIKFRNTLLENSGLGTCLIWLPRLVRNHFSNSSIKSLKIEIFADPEDDVKKDELYLIIETVLDTNTALASLSSLNKDLIAWGEKGSMINVVVNYV